jgi:D-glycero-D-manno-heptose 1,7-bisphosphate phosphatase
MEADARVRLLVLDRDGTLNRSLGHRPPNAVEEVDLFEDLASPLFPYVDQGWKLVIVTNQGGVASGYISDEQAHTVQQRVIDLLPVPIAAAYLCPHMPGAAVPRYDLDCPNRKPRPGFILHALQRFGAQPHDCLLVGDSITDRDAAHAAHVPFRWADQFFRRPIRRGMQTGDGDWFDVRQVSAGRGQLALQALERGELIGSLALSRLDGPEALPDRAIEFSVQTEPHRVGVGLTLVEIAIEWLQGHTI